MSTPGITIVRALYAYGGDADAVSAALGCTPGVVRTAAKRAGISIRTIQRDALASVKGVTGDDLPSAEPVLASALVDMAALGMALQDAQAALEQEQRISATLTRELETHAHG